MQRMHNLSVSKSSHAARSNEFNRGSAGRQHSFQTRSAERWRRTTCSSINIAQHSRNTTPSLRTPAMYTLSPFP